METIDKWFSREVLRWRSGAAVAWLVISMPLVAVVYAFAGNFHVFHPLQWIIDFSSCVLSLSFVTTVLLLMLVNGAYYAYQRNTFTVIPTVSVTRFTHLPQLCTPAIIVHSCVCTWAGLFLGWICTSFVGGRYGSLSYRCEEGSDLYCINEYHLFLVLYGGYTGLMYIVYHYVKQNNVILFPQIHQAKFFQVRNQIIGTAWLSLGHVVWHIKFFYLLYYLLGHVVRDAIAGSLSLSYRSSYHLDSLYGLLFDMGLLWQSLLVGQIIQFSWSYGALFHKVYNTESFEFPISSMFDNYKNKCLVDALSCTSQPLVQALGFLDLNELSKHNYIRRKELFCLSQPGGHPHNWNKIVSVCVSVLTGLSDTVQETNWHILAQAPVRQANNNQPDKYTHSTGGGIGSEIKEKPAEGTSKPSVRERIVNGIKKRPILKFFSADVAPDTKNKNLFASAFIQIWAVEALSSLVSASYHEDSFGVVQMALPDIITAILNLQENVDKHFKLTGGVSRRVQKDLYSTSDTVLKYQLQASLRTSIYGIVNTFGKHLLDAGLPSETEKKLQQFLDYRE